MINDQESKFQQTNEDRSEEDIVSMRGISVTFGDKQYRLNMRRFKQSRDWINDYLVPFTQDAIPLLQSSTPDKIDSYAELMTETMKTCPDQIFELLKAYDPSQNWDEIAEVAYPDDVNVAFSRVVDACFPFASSIAKSLGIVATQRTLSGSGAR